MVEFFTLGEMPEMLVPQKPPVDVTAFKLIEAAACYESK